MIEVGEYVRTKYGIAKIIPDGKYVQEYEDRRILYINNKNGILCDWEFGAYIWSNEVIKHSKNIIDLIEIGDVIEIIVETNSEEENTLKYEVTGIDVQDIGGNRLNQVVVFDDNENVYVELKNIKTILTKEQYKSNCYALGGKSK